MPKRPPTEYTVHSAGTGWFVGIVVTLALLAVGYLVFSAKTHAAPPPTATAFVKLLDDTGHGSGVHIGNGYILTAAHVANDTKDMTLKASDGRSQEATLLWQNTKYDIALMRASKPELLDAVPLDCLPSHDGQAIAAEGNPSDLEFVRTYGKVVGGARKYGEWEQAVPINIAVVPGMSGGAVMADGSVVGITVAVMGTEYGMAAIGYMVPASVVCMLLARTE